MRAKAWRSRYPLEKQTRFIENGREDSGGDGAPRHAKGRASPCCCDSWGQASMATGKMGWFGD